MPTYAFNTLNELVTYLQGQIAPNGTQAITGAKHQDVVVTIALSLVNIVANIPPTTVNQFPPYEAGTVYSGGVEVVVRHDGKLWLFVSNSNQIGVTPGSNGLVWQELSAAQLAHFRNRDEMLDQGGPHQVTAAQIHALLNAPAAGLTWRRPYDMIDFWPPEEPAEDVVYLIDVGAGDAWEGHGLSLARWVSGAWVFEQLNDGDALRWSQGGAIVYVTAGALVPYDLAALGVVPTLAQVLAAGSSTSTYRILLGRTVNEISYDQVVSGYTLLDPIRTPRHRLSLVGDVQLDYSLISGNTQFSIEVTAASEARILTWASGRWTCGNDLSIPSTIEPGEVWLFDVVSLSGKLHIKSISIASDL